jgi:hypothetical protein
VHIPIALRAYSGGRTQVEVAGGASLRRVFERLDAACPGIGDQLVEDGGIRAGIAIFINDEQESEGLIQQVPEEGDIHILPAMGGGADAPARRPPCVRRLTYSLAGRKST